MRALLIGINNYWYLEGRNLCGCLNDVDLIESLLMDKFDFEKKNITRLTTDETDDKPTRQNILSSFQRLIRETSSDEVVFVHYSGHGSRAFNSKKPSNFNETIVPCDSGRSPPERENRDVTDDEIRSFLLALAEKTSNIVLIFDSCHSGHVVRGEEDPDLAKARFVEADLSPQERNYSDENYGFISLREKKADEHSTGPSGWLPLNKCYTLFAACKDDEKAFEMANPFLPGERIGRWTCAVYQAIIQLSLSGSIPLTNRNISELSKSAVTMMFSRQHPIVEGNLDRLFLGTEIHPHQRTMTVVEVRKAENSIVVSGGHGYGLRPGCAIAVCKDRSLSSLDTNILSRAVVSRVTFNQSFADVDDASLVESGLPVFEVAHQGKNNTTVVKVLDYSGKKQQEHVDVQKQKLFQLMNADPLLSLDSGDQEVKFQRSVTVAILDPENQTEEILWFRPVVSCEVVSYVLLGPEGQFEKEPIPVDEAGTEALFKKLQRLSHFYHGLGIQNLDATRSPLFGKVYLFLFKRPNDQCDWQEMRAGDVEALPIITEGWSIGVKIKNSSQLNLYIAVLEFAENGEIDLLVPPEGGEDKIAPGSDTDIIDIGQVTVASKTPNPIETFKLFASTTPADFSILTQTEGFRGDSFRWMDQVTNCLQSLLSAIGYRLVMKRRNNDEHWITVQQQFSLERHDKVLQLWTEFFSSSKSDKITPLTFLQTSFSNCDLANADAFFDKFKLFLQELVNPLFAFRQMRDVFVLPSAHDHDVSLFHHQMCSSAFAVLAERLQQTRNYKEAELCFNALVIMHVQRTSKRSLEATKTYVQKWHKLIQKEDFIKKSPAELVHMARVYVNFVTIIQNTEQRFISGKVAWMLFHQAFDGYQKCSNLLGSLECLNQMIRALTEVKKRHLLEGPDNEEFLKLMARALALTERLKIEPELVTPDVAEMLFSIAQAIKGPLEDVSRVPWQEDTIRLCLVILKGIDIGSQEYGELLVADCNRVLGEAYSERFIGARRENIKLAMEHTHKAFKMYKQASKLFNAQVMVVNLSTYVSELETIAPEETKMGWKELCIKLLHEAMEKPLSKEVEISAKINLMLFQVSSTEYMVDILKELDERENPEAAGRIRTDIVLQSMARNRKELDPVHQEILTLTGRQAYSKWFPIMYHRLISLQCSGNDQCYHTKKNKEHLENAMELLAYFKFDQARVRGVYGRFLATNCGVTASERLQEGVKYLNYALISLEVSWPSYNAQAQLTTAHDIALALWEDILDITLSLHELCPEDSGPLLKVLELFYKSKSRNILLASMGNQKDYAGESGTLVEEYVPISKLYSDNPSLDFKNEFGQLDLNCFASQLVHGETVVQWWMSLKAYAVCIAYSKSAGPVLFKTWSPEETLDLFKACSELSTLGFSQSKLQHLSRCLFLSEMVQFLKDRIPGTRKLILVPHAHLHYIPMHILPLDDGSQMLNHFQDGITFLPNVALLRNRTHHIEDFNVSARRILIFQADPEHNLPYSDLEARKIQEHAAESNLIEQVAIYPKATVNQFVVEQCSRPSYLHLACHGVWDEADSNQSYLLLQDGKVMLPELRKVQVSSCRLVVLSACNTGLREMKQSQMTDMYLGFGAQLLANGCQNVILSLAPVPDQSTYLLMDGFYQKILLEEKGISKALAESMLELNMGFVKHEGEHSDAGMAAAGTQPKISSSVQVNHVFTSLID